MSSAPQQEYGYQEKDCSPHPHFPRTGVLGSQVNFVVLPHHESAGELPPIKWPERAPCCIELAILSSTTLRQSCAFLMREIGTPRFWLVEHVNAFVNESKVGIDFVDFR